MYNKDVPFPIWTHDEWWSDDWDPKSYGRDFDFSRPFFDQSLLNSIKKSRITPLWIMPAKTVIYANMNWRSKNCYLVFGCIDDENCDYGHILWNSRDCTDCLYLFKSELCYESIDCVNCNKLLYSQTVKTVLTALGFLIVGDAQTVLVA